MKPQLHELIKIKNLGRILYEKIKQENSFSKRKRRSL
jgi:hypothetical protein